MGEVYYGGRTPTAFATAGHLASYAGITPITPPLRQLYTRGEQHARSGNHKLNGHCSVPLGLRPLAMAVTSIPSE